MASTDDENVSGRRTRSSRKSLLQQPVVAASPVRATRRSAKKQAQEQVVEPEEAPEIMHEEEIIELQENSDMIRNIMAEAADAVNLSDHQVVDEDDDGAGGVDHNDIIYETVVEEEVIEMVAQDDDCIVYDDEPQEDVEMYAVQEDEHINTEIPLASETGGLDEKSSSFPFGTVGQSETSEDAQNEEEEASESNAEETGVAESSLLASMAGDNANSLPSVGGGEETDVCSKREEFETTKTINQNHQLETIQPNCEKMDSDDSLSEPAIAEDITPIDSNNVTIVNAELVSEDELPLPTKPEINDAEEVSDEELPAPQRAELPADAEVISEDELPTAPSTANEKHSPKNESTEIATTTTITSIHSTEVTHKRKTDDSDNDNGGVGVGDAGKREKTPEKHHKTRESSHKKRSEEQYNPMSPTSESNDAPPVLKKAKLETANETEHKEKKRDREKDKERERERDKDKDKEREREREKDKDKHREKDREREKDSDRDKDKEKDLKERKKLPDLDKYWRAVKEDPADFTGWTYLLQYVDNESDAEAAREAYDAFLSHYPYCYGYWRKYADYEKRKGVKANCNAVFERGLEAIPLSVDLWIHYLSHTKSNHADNDEYIRSQFERAINACGLEFRSDKLWDAYIKWECDGKRYQRVVQIFDRLLAIPTQGYSGHFNNFQDLINQHSLTSTISSEEIKKIRLDLRDSSSSSRSSSSRSKSRRGSSKEKEREHKDEGNAESSSNKSPTHREHKDAEHTQEEAHGTVEAMEVTERDKAQEDLSDLSTLTEDEITAIKDKVISIRRKLHKNTVAAVTARWTYEEGIKRPYFHVKPLERCQLKNWKDYLDFEIEKGDRKRILVLFERCLIACALYDEFWLKMVRYLETQMEQADVPAITSDVFRRACQIHHPDKPSLHLMWAAFEECQNNFDGAAEVLVNLEKKCPNLLQVAYRRINVERRRGDLIKCRELYEHYISTAKNKTIAGSLAIKYARFLNKICNDLDGGLKVLQQALDKDAANTRVALQMIDMALQRPTVDEDEVVLIMDKFMARENIDPEQKVLFAQRKVEFLEDFGRTARGLQDAQRSLQLALTKANEAKKKRESSPSRKSSSALKDGTTMSQSATQSAYNNGSAAANASYYNSANSASYYGQQNNSGGGGGGAYAQQQSYDGYYNNWQYGSGYSGYGQWSGYGNYY